jgi:hypothetical protein
MPNIVQSIEKVEYFDDHFFKVKLVGDDQPRSLTAVTTYLNAYPKPWLPHYRGMVGNREADIAMHEAMDKGSRVHYGCYMVNTGGAVLFEPPLWKNPSEQLVENNRFVRRQLDAIGWKHTTMQHQDEMLCVWRWRRVLDTITSHNRGAEVVLVNPEHDYAGICDNVRYIEGGAYSISGAKPLELPEGLYVIDFKTGKAGRDHKLQLAAYAFAWERMFPDAPIVGTLTVYLDASTKTGIEGVSIEYQNREQVEYNFQSFKHVQAIWKLENPNAAPKEFEFPALVLGNEPDADEANVLRGIIDMTAPVPAGLPSIPEPSIATNAASAELALGDEAPTQQARRRKRT